MQKYGFKFKMGKRYKNKKKLYWNLHDKKSLKTGQKLTKTLSVKCRPEPKLFKNGRTKKNIYFGAYLMPAGTFWTGFMFGIFNVSIFG